MSKNNAKLLVYGVDRLGVSWYYAYMNSNEIKQLRKRLGLTQKELAARVKVDAITVSRWERNEQKPSSQAQRQLARLAGKAKE